MISMIVVGCGVSPFITITFVLLNEISGYDLIIGDEFKSISAVIF